MIHYSFRKSMQPKGGRVTLDLSNCCAERKLNLSEAARMSTSSGRLSIKKPYSNQCHRIEMRKQSFDHFPDNGPQSGFHLSASAKTTIGLPGPTDPTGRDVQAASSYRKGRGKALN